MALVDFTNPAARAVVRRQAATRCSTMGVDCFKTDFGERIPTDVVWLDGSDPERMHNYYTHLYNRDRLRPAGASGAARARPCCSPGRRRPAAQQFPVHWGGDCESTFESMAETLRGGLSLAPVRLRLLEPRHRRLRGHPGPGVFKRWIAFGLLSSHSRLHGVRLLPGAVGCSTRRPSTCCGSFTRLKMSADAVPGRRRRARRTATGIPMMRADGRWSSRTTRPRPTSTRQYMLGDALLVAPVFSADGRGRATTCPTGTWTHLLTGEHGRRPGAG